MRFALPAIAAAFLLLPHVAQAKQETVIDFRNGQTGGQWQVSGGQGVAPGQAGLHITPTQNIVIYRTDPLPHPTDVIHLTTIAPRQVDVVFVWNPRGTPAGEFVQLPITLPASSEPQSVIIPLDRYGQWDPRPVSIGFAVPGGADFTIVDMTLVRWNFFEKAIEAWRSFWSFDVFTRYSINFLWGPLLTFTPATREALWSQLPPNGWAINRAVYPLLGLLFLGAAIYAFVRRGDASARRRAMTVATVGVAVVWVLFDLRMGLEILSYAHNDVETFVTKPTGERTFRSMFDFHDVLERIRPSIEGQPRLGFIADSDFMLDTSVIYTFYPTQMVLPGEPEAETTEMWLLYLRPDIVITSEGRLMDGEGKILTPPGRIVERFGPNAVLFSTAP